jgi:glucose/arabinose dehydrogenase
VTADTLERVQGLSSTGARRALTALAMAVMCAFAALAARAGLPAAGAGSTTLTAVPLADSFNAPIYAENARGFGDLLFVVEREGEIEVLKDEVKRPRPFLDITDLVDPAGEGGLLSLAFPSDYKKSRRFYVFYTDNEGDIRVDEFKRRKRNELRASAGSRRKVIRIRHPGASNHNGGTIVFGIPGSQANAHQRPKLYISVGDGATQANASDLGNLLGKILRIEPFKRSNPNANGYDIPRNNRFVDGDTDTRDEIYAYGLRNPFRMSVDVETRVLAIGDVGDGSQEEVNICPLASCGPNFGWPQFEGTANHGGPAGPDPASAPMYTYPHGVGGDAVTGGIVMHDPDLPGYDGRYLYADFYDGNLLTFEPDVPNNQPVAPPVDTGVHVDSPAAFNAGAGGQVYVSSLAGTVYKLELEL